MNNAFGLRDLSPEQGAKFASDFFGEEISVEAYTKRIKRLGVTPVGHIKEWKKYGIKATPAPDRN